MYRIALKMLVGNTGKYIGLLIGVFFASLIMNQQVSIFCGLMSRTFGFLDDTSSADIWVMDPKVQFVDDLKPLQETRLSQIRGIEGVGWAMPLYKGLIKARLPSGTFQTCNVVGVDDNTLIGGPGNLVSGKLSDLRRSDAIIVDDVGANGKLAKTLPDGTKDPLKVGDTLELNDRRAVVVGISKVTRTFQSQPVVHTTFSRATTFAPQERKLLTFIMVKAKSPEDIPALKQRIEARSGLKALTLDEFKEATVWYYMKYTGIPINFGIAVVLGFVIGLAIVAQTLYSFVLDNLKYFGALKAMGATNSLLLKMITVQAAYVGVIGYGLGLGVASTFAEMSKGTELAFRMMWQVPLFAGIVVAVICVLSAAVSLIKVFLLEPAVVFRS